MSDYTSFLDSKAIRAVPTGLPNPAEPPSMLFPFQRDIVKWALRRGRAAIFADCGLGKGLPPSTKVLSPDGWVSIGSVETGDLIIGKDGLSHSVTAVFKRGIQDTYRVKFSDGTDIVCDSAHIWSVKSPNDLARGNGWRDMSTADLLASQLRYGANGQSRMWNIPMVDPIHLNPQPSYVIHPYLLGVLLGDGSMSGMPLIHGEDDWIIDTVERMLPEGVIIRPRKIGVKSCRYWGITNSPKNAHKRNPVMAALDNLKLSGITGKRKFIPKSYLMGSPADRLALLQGLMDTDGYCGTPTPEFSNGSKALADAVVWIVESLGGTGHITEKVDPRCTYKGKVSHGDRAWRVTMSLPPGVNPFALPRKADHYKPTSRGLGRWIDSIEFESMQETVCIAIDSPDHLYVTEHCIVTHNTPMQLSWADQVPGKVLILAPLAVAQQTCREGQKFGIDVTYARSTSDARITITNYEMLDRFNPSDYAGIVLDESSILKSYDGKFRNQIIDSFRETPFKLACTATPAPNDHMELGNHAEFFGILSRTEMLSTFFVHDGGDTSQWRLKGHAQRDFWQWVCSWAVMIRKPSDLGYDDGDFILPPLVMHQHVVEALITPEGALFALEATTLQERQQARKGTTQERCQAVADLVAQKRGEPWLIWCNLNNESETVSAMIPGAVEVTGSDSNSAKESAMLGFVTGDVQILVSKPSICGYGMNFQRCANVAFLGLSDSYEQFYQAVRRSYRFGQKQTVNCHIVTSDIEGAVVANIQRKEADAARMAEEMVSHMRDMNEADIRGSVRTNDKYTPAISMEIPQWLRTS